MARPASSHPTDGELEILRVLWQRDTATVRQVFEELRQQGRTTGYTSVLKTLQIMTEKGLVTRDESAKTHIYRAHSSEAKTQQNMVADLMKKAFGGSFQKLVMQALSAKKATRQELEAVQKLIDQFKSGTK